MISTVVIRTQPDAKLAALAADGSEAAFEAIVHRYRRILIAYCRRMLLSESRSEDVVQQAFMNAWGSLRAGTKVRDVKAWLYRITHNQLVSALRRPGFDFDELNESLRGADAPEADLERRVLMRETLAAVAALPALQREAILRTAVDGSSYEQVATALGVTDTAVRGLVYRARTSLRQGLAAFAPAPVVIWAAGQPRRGGLSQTISAAVSGGGAASASGLVLKGASVLAASAVVVGGTVGGAIYSHLFARPTYRQARTATTRADAHSSLAAVAALALRDVARLQSRSRQTSGTRVGARYMSTDRTSGTRRERRSRRGDMSSPAGAPVGAIGGRDDAGGSPTTTQSPTAQVASAQSPSSPPSGSGTADGQSTPGNGAPQMSGQRMPSDEQGTAPTSMTAAPSAAR